MTVYTSKFESEKAELDCDVATLLAMDKVVNKEGLELD